MLGLCSWRRVSPLELDADCCADNHFRLTTVGNGIERLYHPEVDWLDREPAVHLPGEAGLVVADDGWLKASGSVVETQVELLVDSPVGNEFPVVLHARVDSQPAVVLVALQAPRNLEAYERRQRLRLGDLELAVQLSEESHLIAFLGRLHDRLEVQIGGPQIQADAVPDFSLPPDGSVHFVCALAVERTVEVGRVPQIEIEPAGDPVYLREPDRYFLLLNGLGPNQLAERRYGLRLEPRVEVKIPLARLVRLRLLGLLPFVLLLGNLQEAARRLGRCGLRKHLRSTCHEH